MARKFDLISELYERTCFAVTDNPVNWQSFLKTAGLMDNDVLAYRVLLEKRKENAPFWEKKVLTVEEAAEYTGIGRTKIRQIIMRGDCPFAVTNGVQVCVIRDKFIDYLDKQFSI